MSDDAHHDRDGHEPDLNALSALIDHRLAPDEHARVVEHLGSCARCRDIVARLHPMARVQRRSQMRVATLSLAASLVIAAGGAWLYLAARNGAPVPSTGDAAPEPASPSAPLIPVSPPSAPEQAAPAVQPPPGATSPPADRTRAAGVKAIRGKTFRLVAGEWIDTAYDPTDFLPVVEVASQEDFDAHPALLPFRSVGPRFTIVLDKTIYRVQLPPTQH